MTTEQTRPDRDTAAGDLEDALTDIRNACTLINSGDNDDIVLARYLGRQIEDHHLAAAWNAYCRIFALDDHREGARPLVRPIAERAKAEVTPRHDPSNSDAINDLECALTDISGLADVLFEMGKHRGGDAAAYVGNRLQEHYQQAHAAFCIVSGLGGGGAQ